MDGPRNARQFSELLLWHRIRARLTQQQLADFATLSVRAIRDLERGRAQRPRQDTVRLLADVLRLDGQHRATFERASCGDPGELGDRLEPSAGHVEGGGDGRPMPPAPLTPIVGRSAELRVLTTLVTVEQHRLVTVVGLAGIGKTRLVQEVARTLHFDAGWTVLWVPALDLRGGPGSSLAARIGALLAAGGPVGELADAIGTRDTLLVLDGQDTARLPRGLLDLVRRCPGLRVVATALAPSDLPGEHILPLGPLELPAPRDERNPVRFAAIAAVRLLTSRITRFRPGFALEPDTARVVGELCRALDGVPQALEVAASWCLVHSPEALLHQVVENPCELAAPFPAAGSRADMVESVQRTIAVADPALRQQLARLARLDGSWSIAEAAARCGVAPVELARSVHALLLRGLLRREGDTFSDRFAVLNVVRANVGARPALGRAGLGSPHAVAS